MDAKEAKALADQVSAKQMMAGYLHTVEKAARLGSYECVFGLLAPNEINALRILGFNVEGERNMTVSWRTEPERCPK